MLRILHRTRHQLLQGNQGLQFMRNSKCPRKLNGQLREYLRASERHHLPSYREPGRIDRKSVIAATQKSWCSQASITYTLAGKAGRMRSPYCASCHGYLGSKWPCYLASKVCLGIIASNPCIEQGHQTFCLPGYKVCKQVPGKQKLCRCLLVQPMEPMRSMMPTALAHQRAGHRLRRYTMDSKMRNRSIRAAQSFLKRREFEVMDTWEHQDFCGVVAKDSEDALVFAQVLCKLADDEGFPKESSVDRCELEVLATDWLKARDEDSWETQVRFDIISILVLNEDRAFLRHHVNALGRS